jgi:hypothetical protein
MFYQLQLDYSAGQKESSKISEAYGDLWVPHNNNSFEMLEEIHVLLSSLSKSHLPVSSRNSALIHSW